MPNDYPHQFSGGMRQRAMIAMAIANEPDVLIADEPTTALDVTIQAQVLDVLERIQERTNSAIMLITHDLGVVAGLAERVLVMYAGRQVELGIGRRHLLPARPSVHTRAPRVVASTRPARRRAIACTASRVSRRHSCSVPSGCAFHPRCPVSDLGGLCSTTVPEPRVLTGSHVSACHFATTLDAREEHE